MHVALLEGADCCSQKIAGSNPVVNKANLIDKVK